MIKKFFYLYDYHSEDHHKSYLMNLKENICNIISNNDIKVLLIEFSPFFDEYLNLNSFDEFKKITKMINKLGSESENLLELRYDIIKKALIKGIKVVGVDFRPVDLPKEILKDNELYSNRKKCSINCNQSDIIVDKIKRFNLDNDSTKYDEISVNNRIIQYLKECNEDNYLLWLGKNHGYKTFFYNCLDEQQMNDMNVMGILDCDELNINVIDFDFYNKKFYFLESENRINYD